jgi:hypothetical protein
MTDTAAATAPEQVRDALVDAYTDAEGLGRSTAWQSAADAAYTAALTAVYWRLRRHADAYRDTTGYRRAQERWEQSGRRDTELLHKLSVHVNYARGIDAAAREVADMLGIPEHEIEPVDSTTQDGDNRD